MIMNAFMAFLHHVAAFALVAGIAVEFVLIRQPIDAANARRLALADAVVGLSAGVLIVVGLLRVFYFEKGASFYFHNGAFIAKMGLFAAVALLSLYPTLKFIAWRKGAVDAAAVRKVRRILHLELVGVVLILLCAAAMARGILFLG
jgi:putative membrane protein